MAPEELARGFHAAMAALLAGTAPQGVGDIDEFVAWLGKHWLAPWAAHAARRVAPDLAERLRREEKLALGSEMSRGIGIAQLLKAFEQRGVTPIVFKGVGLAAGYYEHAHLRPFGDIDLMVSRVDLDKAIEAARGVGFASETSDPMVGAYFRDAHYNVPLVHPDMGLLEIHHALYRDIPDGYVEGAIARSVPATAFDVPVRRLSGPDLFVVLAVHFGISAVGSRWLWLLDLVLVGRTLNEAEWNEVVSTARDGGLQLFVGSALVLMDDLWAVRFRGVQGVGVVQSVLADDLRLPERMALQEVRRAAGDEVLSSHLLSVARRMSGRSTRAGLRGALEAIICHPGVVCMDYGVRSDEPWFWAYRAWHSLQRGGSAVQTVLRPFARAKK